MTSELKGKAIKGISWSLFERFGVQGMTFVMGIIMARLLTPEAYGLIGMITVFFAVARVFIDSGFGQAYVQKKEVTDIDANTVFYTNFGISLLLYFILWFSAPAISRFYEEPELIELTRVMGLVVIINAFNVIQVAQIKRNINFKRKTKVTIISTLLSGVGGITAAYTGMGVWSLVVQQMSRHFFTTLGLWITSKWKPGIAFSVQSFKELFSFGSWLLFSSILREVFDNIYKLTIGKFFPAAQLGFYTKAKEFQKIIPRQTTNAISEVAFPVFSQMQDDKVRLQETMRKFLTHTLFLIGPFMVLLAIIAEPLVILLLKEKWAPMVPYLQLMTIIGILFPIHSVNVRILLAQGKSRLNFNLEMLKNGIRVINIIVMYRFGVIYIILGEVILSFIALAINTFYTKKLIDYGLFRQLKDIGLILTGALVAGLITYSLTLIYTNYWLILLAGSVLFMGVYVLFNYLLNRQFLLELISLKEHFKK